MSTKLKSGLLLLLTLVIGMVLGAMMQARFSEQRLDRLVQLRSQEGMVRAWEASVEPLDEAQRQAVRAAFQETAQQVSEIFRRSRGEVQVVMDEMKAKLARTLTEEQMQQLEHHFQMRRQGGRPPGHRERGQPRQQ